MRIQKLPVEIANQIAAGEVIERPASVVKELLENCLDAGATQITIDIGFGGLNEIKISDNGCGIIAEDLPLAIAAHATSKITRLDDLYALTSMGFRGEALASIASISRLILSSKTASQEYGLMLEKNADKVSIIPCPHNQGTTVIVRDLFYNAPVRKKFLKSEKMEFLAIDQVVRRFALAAPHISLQLNHNGKSVLALPGANNQLLHQLRIKRLFGSGFWEQALALDIEEAGIQVKGWFSGAGYQRSQNDRLWIYLNGRMVKDRLLTNAVHQAYADILHPGRHPACLLYIQMDPAKVDVNVHPSKNEVRFQEPRCIHDLISLSLTKVLSNSLSVQSSADNQQFENIQQLDFLMVKEPLVSPTMNSPRPLLHWLRIHEDYYVLQWTGQVFLIDMRKLGQSYLYDSLTENCLPLLSRPLLVPLSMPLLKPLHQKQQEQLSLYGIKTLIEDRQYLHVESLPIALPQLQINNFLAAFIDEAPTTHAAIIQLLAQHNSQGAFLDEDEKEQIDIFVHDTLARKKECPWALLLNEERCRGLWDV